MLVDLRCQDGRRGNRAPLRVKGTKGNRSKWGRSNLPNRYLSLVRKRTQASCMAKAEEIKTHPSVTIHGA